MSAAPKAVVTVGGNDNNEPSTLQQQQGPNSSGTKIQQRRILLPPTVAQVYARALWDPTPTTTSISQRKLAYALGYPIDWRVERIVEIDEETGKPIIRDRIHATGGKKNQIKYMWLHHEAAQRAALRLEQEGTLNPIGGGTTTGETTGSGTIKAGNKSSSNATATTATGSHLLPPTPLYNKGDIVQVLYDGSWWEATITKRKKQADAFLYGVKYHGDEATQNDVEEQDIRSAENPSDLAVSLGFTGDWKASRKGPRYILTAPTGETYTNKKAAMKVFRELLGKVNPNRHDDDDVGDPPWRLEGHELIGREIVWTFEHKASATRKITIEQVGTVVGYIDAKDKDKVQRMMHAVSFDCVLLVSSFVRLFVCYIPLLSTRVCLSHVGKLLVGFSFILIPPPSNQNGEPGFISESTGNPANLFHVTFPDDPNHPYQQHLIHSQDLEEYEVVERLRPRTETYSHPSTETLKGDGSGGNKRGGNKASPQKNKKRRRS